MQTQDIKYIVDSWYDFLVKDGNHPCFFDEKIHTRKEVEILSGKIYHYLLSHNITKEDVVLIQLERDWRAFTSILGIIKAGACYIALEKNYPKDRLEYILNDTKPVFIINEDTLEDIYKCDYKKGYVVADEHDAAYIVYTSGTTGKPKGVLHEYGDYKLAYMSQLDDIRFDESTRFANIAPLNFIASILIFTYCIYSGACIYFPSNELIKNPINLIDYYNNNKIDETFLVPTLIKHIGDYINSEMKYVFTGSENTNNLSICNGKLINYYLMSEVGFVICQYTIDKSLDSCPIGKPCYGVEIKIDDNNELLCKNPYCRGYLNNKDLNTKLFKDGFYHTGDIAYYGQDNNIYLKGRLNDMFKINGNRVEPLEIEKVVKQQLNIDSICKGKEDGINSSITLFYVNNEEISDQTFRNALTDKLPYYMIPNAFIRIDSIPLTEMGKLDRKSTLLDIDIKKDSSITRDELQQRLIQIFKDVLDLKTVNLDDDFYKLGGDSMKTIEAISKLRLQNFEPRYFYIGRNINGIIDTFFKNNIQRLSELEKEQIGRTSKLEPCDMSSFMLSTSLNSPNSTSYNLSFAYRLSKLINIEKLRDAINTYISNSSMFNTTSVMIDEITYVKYVPELYKNVEIEKMDEDSIENLKRNFVKPFNLIGDLPYRIKLIESNKHNYLFLDIHHYITDGEGLRLIFEDILNIYYGKKPNGTNNYFAYLYDENNKKNSEYMQECLSYYDNKFGRNLTINSLPLSNIDNREFGETKTTYNTSIKTKDINSYIKLHKIDRRILFLAVTFLTIVKYNKQNVARIRYVVSNRAGNRNHSGLLFRISMIELDFEKYNSFKDLYEDIANQILSNNKYLYTSTPAYSETGTDYEIVVDDLDDVFAVPSILSGLISEEELDRPYDLSDGCRSYTKYMQFFNKENRLKIRFTCDLQLIPKNTQDKFMSLYIDILAKVVNNTRFKDI